MSEQKPPRRPEGSQFTCVWKGVRPTEEELKQILEDHEKWIEEEYLPAREKKRIPPDPPHDLSGTDLSGAILEEADLRGAKLRKADLSPAELENGEIVFTILSRADLTDTDLHGAILEKADLSGAKLDMADLSGTILEEADLSGANLWIPSLSGANLNGADLSGAKLWVADFSDAFLENTNCSNADLRSANLSGASLFGADLSDANLSSANLIGADLREANFSNCNVTGIRYHGPWFNIPFITVRKPRTLVCRSIRAETCYGSPRFKRDVMDQDFLEEMRETTWGKALYWLWRISCDCGRSFLRWAFLSIILAGLFAALYYWVLPDNAFFQTPPAYQNQSLDFWHAFYFSVVTFTTLGFGDVVANSDIARVLVGIEVVLGYIMLGGLISILANKLARRS